MGFNSGFKGLITPYSHIPQLTSSSLYKPVYFSRNGLCKVAPVTLDRLKRFASAVYLNGVFFFFPIAQFQLIEVLCVCECVSVCVCVCECVSVCAPAVGRYRCVTTECRACLACCNGSSHACNTQANLAKKSVYDCREISFCCNNNVCLNNKRGTLYRMTCCLRFCSPSFFPLLFLIISRLSLLPLSSVAPACIPAGQ